MTKEEYERKASNYLKAQLKLRGMSYKDLAEALIKNGNFAKPENLTKMINDGKFSLAFTYQCAEAMGMKQLIMDIQSDI